jgi:hypothetical protein
MVVAMSEIVVNPFDGAKPARNLSRIKKQFLANLTLRRKHSIPAWVRLQATSPLECGKPETCQMAEAIAESGQPEGMERL